MSNRDPQQIWVVLFQGFTQDASRTSGFEKLWMKLGEYRADLANRELREWHSRPGKLAERIWRLSYDTQGPPRIIVCGYSYGGTTAIRFCNALAKRGLMVESLFLCDPVWRPFMAFPSCLSIFPWFMHRVPKNVEECHVYNQTQNLPRGHKVIARNKATVMHGPFHREMDHAYMDDDPIFHGEVLHTVRMAVLKQHVKAESEQ